jgi:hypothetical protein
MFHKTLLNKFCLGYKGSCSSSVIIETRLWAGQPGFNSWQGQCKDFFSTASRQALVPTQPHIQWVLGVLTPGVEWLEHEADLSPLSNAKAKNALSYTSILLISLHGVVLS